MQAVSQAPSSSRRKRFRFDGSVNRASQQSDELSVSEQPDALHAHLPSSWGVKRRRSKIGGGLLDPGTPTNADLAASSTVFVGQDAFSFAGAEEDFPAFNDEEMAWLMELLPF